MAHSTRVAPASATFLVLLTQMMIVIPAVAGAHPGGGLLRVHRLPVHPGGVMGWAARAARAARERAGRMSWAAGAACSGRHVSRAVANLKRNDETAPTATTITTTTTTSTVAVLAQCMLSACPGRGSLLRLAPAPCTLDAAAEVACASGSLSCGSWSCACSSSGAGAWLQECMRRFGCLLEELLHRVALLTDGEGWLPPAPAPAPAPASPLPDLRIGRRALGMYRT